MAFYSNKTITFPARKKNTFYAEGNGFLSKKVLRNFKSFRYIIYHFFLESNMSVSEESVIFFTKKVLKTFKGRKILSTQKGMSFSIKMFLCNFKS